MELVGLGKLVELVKTSRTSETSGTSKKSRRLFGSLRPEYKATNFYDLEIHVVE